MFFYYFQLLVVFFFYKKLSKEVILSAVQPGVPSTQHFSTVTFFASACCFSSIFSSFSEDLDLSILVSRCLCSFMSVNGGDTGVD